MDTRECADEWMNDTGLRVYTAFSGDLWFFYLQFIHSLINSLSRLFPGACSSLAVLCVPRHEIFRVATKKLRAKKNLFLFLIEAAILTQVWARTSNLFFSLGLIFDFS